MKNFKIKSTKPMGCWFTKGNIYDVIDGVLTDDYGNEYHHESIESVNSFMGSRFELVLDKTIDLSDENLTYVVSKGKLPRVDKIVYTNKELRTEFNGSLKTWDGSLKNLNLKMSYHYNVEFEILEENMRFKKEDLQLFDVVEWRNGWLMMVIEHEGKRYFSGITEQSHNGFNFYDEWLRSSNEFEPVKVYRPKYAYSLRNLLATKSFDDYKLLWEENQQVELTLDEIADKFGVKVENLKIKK